MHVNNFVSKALSMCNKNLGGVFLNYLDIIKYIEVADPTNMKCNDISTYKWNHMHMNI